MATVKHVVLDSGAFLRNVTVQDIGEKLYTIVDVVNEIKDKATKDRLQVLPYELVYREPSMEAIKIVTEFSKKTGDYRSLSAVDIRVMALSYQLEKETVGTEHLKKEPEKKVQWTASKQPLQKATDIAGFYIKSQKGTLRTTSKCSSIIGAQTELRSDEVSEVNDNTNGETEHHEPFTDPHEMLEESEALSKTIQEYTETDTYNMIEDMENPCKDIDGDKKLVDDSIRCNKIEEILEGEIVSEDCLQEDSDESCESDDEDEEDDGEGWITPSNIQAVKEKMGEADKEKACVLVGCLTTDFAMQNVMIQMGLNVISVDGMLIKQAKSYVLRCFGCMKITTDVEKLFCPHCGNKTLSKVSMTVSEDGSIKYYLSRRRPFYIRGTKYKLPLPKGGKHAENPVLVEDQPSPHNKLSKKERRKLDVFDPDYVANNSPFAINDVTSRAAQLGLRSHKGQTHYWQKINPNAVNKNCGRRK